MSQNTDIDKRHATQRVKIAEKVHKPPLGPDERKRKKYLGSN